MNPSSPQGPGVSDPNAEAKSNPFSTGVEVPWCNGCSYIQLNGIIQTVLARLYSLRDVVLVSDIGCIGIVDKLYACDTVHGLHGRSVTLAAGLKMAHENPALKVVVFIGDGGCSIGLQNLVDAARLNVDLTVFSFDNQNYGMTGGQHSTLTLPEVKTTTTPDGNTSPPNDLVRLLGAYPGVFRARLTANSPQISETIELALEHPGFSYLETLNFCSSYAGRLNPNLALAKAQRFCEAAGRDFGLFPAEKMASFSFPQKPIPKEAVALHSEEPEFNHALQKPMRMVLGGSAGGGVQSAASLFTRAAVKSGLHISLKSDYPVTVGKGHSTCEIILSPEPILFAGVSRPELAIVCTDNGKRALGPLVSSAGEVVFNEALAMESGTAMNFQRHGSRHAPFYALAWMLQQKAWFPAAALKKVVSEMSGEPRKKSLLRILEGEFDLKQVSGGP